MNILLKSFLFLQFLSLLFFPLNSLTILLPQNSLYQRAFPSEDPIHYISLNKISQNSTIANNADFCNILQPKFDFLYFSQVFDQTDSTIFANEHYMLGIDNFLIILLKKGVLQLFITNFTETAAKLSHLNEFLIKDSALLKEIAGNGFIALFYQKTGDFLMILSRKSLLFVSLDMKNNTFRKESAEFRVYSSKKQRFRGVENRGFFFDFIGKSCEFHFRIQ